MKKTRSRPSDHPLSRGIIAINLDEGDRLIRATLTSGNDHVLLATRDGYAIRFPETDVRPMGRAAGGVKGIKLREDDKVVGMAVPDETASLLTVCENGYGKRTEFGEYPVQGRGGLGVINIKTTERNGKVVGIMTVRDEDDLMMTTAQGMVIRTAVSQMRTIGRATQGVTLIRCDEGDRLVAIARVMEKDMGDEAPGAAESPRRPRHPKSSRPIPARPRCPMMIPAPRSQNEAKKSNPQYPILNLQ